MRILLLTQFYPPVIGGEERHVRNLGAALAARGHQVSVATQAAGAERVTKMDGAVRVHRLRGTAQRIGGLFAEADRPHAPPVPDLELMIGLRRVLAQERPEIVHAHNWLLHSFLPLKHVSRAPFLVTLHDYSFVCVRKNLMHIDHPCDGPGLRKCLGCASQHYSGSKGSITTLCHRVSTAFERSMVDRFIAVSQAVASFNGLPGGEIPYDIIPNFVPDDIDTVTGELEPALFRQLPEQFILYVGDLSWQKGIQLLLDAYRQTGTDTPLILIGRRFGDTPINLPSNVHALGPWPHTAIMHAWSRCLFGVAPSIWHEPCATVVMEAMAQGKPMLVTNMGGMPDMVADGDNGFVVPASAAPLAAGMATLLANAALRQRMGADARRRIQWFKASTVTQRIEAVYHILEAQRAYVA